MTTWTLKTFTALALASAALAAQAEVWKCKSAGGGVVYSEQPCPGAGEALDRAVLQPNTLETVPPARPAAAPPAAQAVAAQPAAPAPAANVCPGDRELRDMETQATSIALGPEERRFIEDEIRRARQCRKGQGHYTGEDWRILREAREAQSSPSQREAARQRAEGVHSAADPLEGQRIAERRMRERQARERAAHKGNAARDELHRH